MNEVELVTTLNNAVHEALLNGDHTLSERELIERVDAILSTMPTMGGSTATGGLLLRRYRSALHRELCVGTAPRQIPHVIEDEVRMITRAVMVAIEAQEGISVEASVLLALVIRARGLPQFCATPPDLTRPA